MNKATFEKIFKPLINFWKGMDKGKKIRLGIIAAVIIVVVSAAVMFLNQKDYEVLYDKMDTQEAGEVLNKLKDMKVDAKVQDQGTIMVPKAQAETVRMQLAADGYPKSTLNYDIFQNSTGFGTTDFEKQKYLQFQLQERLQNSIKSLDMVDDCIVTLNIPDNSSFVLKDDKQKASASVILKLKNDQTLKEEQVKGIEGLVAKSIPGLTEDQVLIVDNLGNSLKGTDDTQAGIAGSQLELEQSTSDKLQKQIMSLLEPVFGVGKVNAGVRVTLDFNKQTTESTQYNPVGDSDKGIAVSSNVETENMADQSQAAGVGQDANGAAPQYQAGNTGNGNYDKSSETTNYEVNQVKDTIQKAEGQIKDISVSVLLDDSDLQDGADQKVKDIVAGALGVPQNNVTVQTISFNGTNGINQILSDSQKTNEQVKRQALIRNSIVYGVLGLLLLGILLFVLKKSKKKENETGAEIPIPEESGFDLVVDDEIADIKPNKNTKRDFIEKNINKNPELIAQLLRNWLNDDIMK